MPHPPCRGTGAAPHACAVLASCLRHVCNEGKTTSPPPPPHASAPPRSGDEGREGRTAPPPSRGQSGKMGMQRGEGAGRTKRPCPKEARAVQAPAGGAPGERTQSGKGDDGGHAACPTPQQRDKCRAMCQRRACGVLTPEEGQRGHLPPPPTPTPTKERGEGSEGVARGHGGGIEDRPTCQGKGLATSGKKKTATTNRAYQRARGRKREHGDQHRGERGEAGVTWARRGRW